MLWLQTNKAGSGTMNLGGSLTRQVCCQLDDMSDYTFSFFFLAVCMQASFLFITQVEMDAPVGDSSPHIANIGRMVEVSIQANILLIKAI